MPTERSAAAEPMAEVRLLDGRIELSLLGSAGGSLARLTPGQASRLAHDLLEVSSRVALAGAPQQPREAS